MSREAIISQTINAINFLPEEKASEISDFAEFIVMKYEEQTLTDNIQKMVTNSKAFNFLKEDEELYSVSDLKENYNDKG